jgi:hypothetical protein
MLAGDWGQNSVAGRTMEQMMQIPKPLSYQLNAAHITGFGSDTFH